MSYGQMSVAKGRSGKLKIGLLLWLIVLGGAGYYSMAIGGVYWRRYRLEDAVMRDLSFAGQLTDEAIQRHVLEQVDQMNLPPEARRVQFVRTEGPRALQVTISYAETVNLLFTTRQFPVSIHIRRVF